VDDPPSIDQGGKGTVTGCPEVPQKVRYGAAIPGSRSSLGCLCWKVVHPWDGFGSVSPRSQWRSLLGTHLCGNLRSPSPEASCDPTQRAGRCWGWTEAT